MLVNPFAVDFCGSFRDEVVVVVVVGLGKPAVTGGGRSIPSAAFFDSWRAKSEACHHSRNLRAKMEVGRRILRLDSRRG